eukprot:CAMPEP_0184717532 /NCGR_PEP_ID=MMETSP0314-20130426/6973_1 /TAXON_ID=38298 /ORGANISM="Rhodella maculata, Strain CCMP 736" /LENGTH=150 /DNA_ID=CAMNT_0027181119 /DNA_START=128 /DNA_END=580 /DNA_ORIENTATION=+
MSAVSSSDGRWITLTSLSLILSCMKKYLIAMCLERLELGFPFFISAIVDRLSCSRIKPCTFAPIDSSNRTVQIPCPYMPLAATSSASVDALLTILCFVLVAWVAPRPRVTHAPVWLFPSAWTPYDASTDRRTNRSSSAPKFNPRPGVPFR